MKKYENVKLSLWRCLMLLVVMLVNTEASLLHRKPTREEIEKAYKRYLLERIRLENQDPFIFALGKYDNQYYQKDVYE
ncbi:hypothetical protein TSAR_012023 [Trichomalopsis sarcophagae]|uniref:Uncharacterized protein n=1 Tax=Trichomalopsis sarcophagae TaxID=543379 RepID=A0A232F7D7_9HYME|nr:hypothetical protein TSAR_012023 [Trichomalopsis sarcophagae]